MDERIKGYDVSGLYLGEAEFPKSPRVLTRVEKGQALTHAEADFNLGSLLHTASFSKAPQTFEQEGLTEEQQEKRRLEQAGMYVTLSYAPIEKSGEILNQNKDIIVKVQHGTDEILEKIANECVPGTLDIKNDLTARENLKVEKDVIVKNNLQTKTGNVTEDFSVSKDLHVHGNVYCDGTIYGNISTVPYVDEFKEKGDTWNKEHPRKSDRELKSNVVEISGALGKLSEIRGCEFDWKDSGKHDVGVIAQEVQKVVPEAVRQGADGYLEVCYTRLVPLLIQSIKELQQEICELKKKQESLGN